MRNQPKITTTAALTAKDATGLLEGIKHRDCIFRLQRIIAYVLRFARQRRSTVSCVPGGDEMEKALTVIIKFIQKESFREDIADLEHHGAVKNSSTISSLTPFIDSDGLLRVGGRLEASNLSFDAKHPMLLPYPHSITKIIAECIHRTNLHPGSQTLMSMIRQRFWPLKLKMLARSIVQKCVLCAKAKPKLMHQLMGNLPAERVQPARPFIISGVDYFGPVWTHFKLRGKRPLKAYVAVFCCFSTKAVHMELVNDLTTDAFIGALKRFMARRGHCQKLYCDNATNFVGARNQIKELYEVIHREESKNKIIHERGKSGIEFSFIPPRAPHFGGLWEAAVKSAKNLLQGLLASASLTYEEMETVIVEAEAILNSRPITTMSSDPNDLHALTPGHLLIGEPLTSTIDPRARVNESSYPSRWKLITYIKAEFWKRWVNEYLSTLQQRHKWKQECQNVKPGTMVIIKDENLPPLKWPLGRIKNIIQGDDGLVRVVDVQTATNVIRRPIHKLAPLPVDTEEPSEIDQQRLDEDVPTAAKRKRVPPISMFTLVLISCLLLPLCLASPLKVQPFESNPGVYFERLGAAGLITSEWNLVTYIDMQTYWRNVKIIHGFPQALKTSCDMNKVQTNCRSIVNLLENLENEIVMRNQLLRSHKAARPKRGAFNIIGNIANSLFGVLDSEYAEESERTIEKLNNNEEAIVAQVNKQTSFLDSTINIMKRDQKIVHDELSQVEKALNKVQNQINQEGTLNTAIGLALQATLELLHLERIQDSLLDILVDTHHGKISPELISPTQLQQELLTIKANLPSNLKLPAQTDELLDFYKLMTIEGRATEKYVIFRIKIPLLTTEFFELLRLFPVPWASNKGFFKIQSNIGFLITNLHRDQILPLKESEFNRCALIKEETFLCRQTHPVHKMGSAEAACEVQLLSHNTTNAGCSIEPAKPGPHWIQLQNPNIWIYSVENNYTLNAVCGTTPIKLALEKSGILTINGECNIKQPLVTIQGHKNFESRIHKFYMPSMNATEMIKQQHEYIKIQGNLGFDDTALEQLQSRLHNFSIHSSNNLSSHDIHHYSISYVTLTILILGSCFLLWHWFKGANIKREPNAMAVTFTQEGTETTDHAAVNEEHERTIITVYDC